MGFKTIQLLNAISNNNSSRINTRLSKCRTKLVNPKSLKIETMSMTNLASCWSTRITRKWAVHRTIISPTKIRTYIFSLSQEIIPCSSLIKRSHLQTLETKTEKLISFPKNNLQAQTLSWQMKIAWTLKTALWAWSTTINFKDLSIPRAPSILRHLNTGRANIIVSSRL